MACLCYKCTLVGKRNATHAPIKVEHTTVASTRIRELLAHYELTPYAAAQKMGHTRPSKLYKLLNGEANPGFDTLIEFLDTWPELSAEWLLRGRGPMLTSTSGSAVVDVVVTDTARPQALHAVTSGRVLAITVDRTGNENILHIPARAQAGYANSHDEPAYLGDLTPYSLPLFTTGTYRSFEVEGDSMKGTFGHRDIVIGQFVDRWDMLQPGHCYVVVLHDNVLVKRLPRAIKSRRDTVELVSDNRAYPVHEVHASDIVELWHVRGCLTTNIPASTREVQERMLEILEALGVEQQQTRGILESLAPGYAPTSETSR